MKLSISKKLILIICLPLLLDVGEIFLFDFSANVFSTMRAYVSGEGLWSKAQKDALNALHRYATTQDEAAYREYLGFMEVPLGDRAARIELQKADPDLDIADAGFIQGRNHPDDVRAMSIFFLRFRNAPYVEDAFMVWRQADMKIKELENLGEKIHSSISEGVSSSELQPLLRELERINIELTVLEDKFSFTLGEATRWAKSLLIGVMLVTSLVLLLLSTAVPLYLGRGVVKSIARLNRAAKDLESGKFTRIEVDTHDELGGLALSFNTMADRLQSSYRQLELDVEARTKELTDSNESLRHEIARRKELEKELRERSNALAETDRRKDEFLAVLSHELRNPLSPIVTTIELLKEYEDINPEVKRNLAVMDQQVSVITRIVNDLLNVSRIVQGKIELRRQQIPLDAVVEAALETVRARAEAKNQTLEVSLPSEPVVLFVDSLRISQVLMNILSNAVKFTPSGGTISLAAKQLNKEVQISIVDSGIGIDPPLLGKVFDAFFQGPIIEGKPRDGLGVGLKIARDLARLHGGDVTVQSQGLGRGTTFTVTIPMENG